METNHSLRAHAKFSPSSLESLELCPGWRNAEDEKEEQWATDGTLCHEATQAKLMGHDAPQTKLNANLASFTQEAYDYAAPRIAGAEKLVLEERVFHANPVLKENCHGTPDLYAITGEECQLIDFKFGRRPVGHAKENLQGWAYALALFDTYEKLQTITIHFCAPRIHNGTSHATFTRAADYDRMLARILRTVERAQANSPDTYASSWSACAYCMRKAACPVLSQSVERAYNLAVDDLSPVRLSEAVKSDSPENLGWLHNAAKLVADWSVQTQERIKKLALEGNAVAGYELRFSKGRTTVRTVAQVIKAGVDIPLDKINQCATIPLAELRKIYTDGVEPSAKEEKEKELMTKLAKGGALKSGEDSVYLYRINENN